MSRFLLLRSLVAVFTLAGCAASQPFLPLRAEPGASPELVLVWVGRGECERMENGVWVRHPELDYDFSVEQRRLGARWESVKSMRRLHPDYDGVAGPRTQTHFFAIDFAPPDAEGKVAGRLTTSLGNGAGVTDREFRHAVLELEAEVSALAPFDRYRITQDYQYEAGRLVELVELNKGPAPWVRNREVATLFGARSFDRAPTTR